MLFSLEQAGEAGFSKGTAVTLLKMTLNGRLPVNQGSVIRCPGTAEWKVGLLWAGASVLFAGVWCRAGNGRGCWQPLGVWLWRRLWC